MKSTNYTKETILSMGMPDRQFPAFRAGDTIRVTTKIVEGDKERLQDFEGVVVGLKGTGITATFRMRKISEGIAVERIFPYCTPTITAITVLHEGVVRRAKLYYLRQRTGKNAEVEKKIVRKIRVPKLRGISRKTTEIAGA